MRVLTSTFKLSMRPWRLAPVSQLCSAVAVGVMLTLTGFLLWLGRSLDPVVARLQSEETITAYLDPMLSSKDEARITDEIREQVERQLRASRAGTVAVRVVSDAESVAANAANAAQSDSIRSDAAAPARANAVGPGRDIEISPVGQKQFIERLRKHYPDLAQEVEGLGSEMQTIVPKFVTVAGVFPEGMVDAVKSVAGVEAVESSRRKNGQVIAAFSTLRWVSRVLAVGLFLALITGLVHLSRINAHLHRDCLALLRIWGAGPWVMRLPALLTGFSVGLLGGTLGTVAWSLLGSQLLQRIASFSPLLQGLQVPGSLAAASLLGLGGLCGVLSGGLVADVPAREHGDTPDVVGARV